MSKYKVLKSKRTALHPESGFPAGAVYDFKVATKNGRQLVVRVIDYGAGKPSIATCDGDPRRSDKLNRALLRAVSPSVYLGRS